MARVNKTIKASGVDYSSLSAFETGLSGSSAADPWTAVCDSGFDLGEVSFNSIGYTPTSQAEAPWVVAAPGHHHRGDKNAGAYISATAAKGIEILVPFVLVDGIRITGDNSQNGVKLLNVSGCQIMHCLIDSCNLGIYNNATTTGTYTIDLYANIIMDCSVNGIRYKCAAGGATSPTITAAEYHNVVNNATSQGIRYWLTTAGGTATMNLTSRNNISVESNPDFGLSNASSTFNATTSNNLSSDATADDWSGTGHLINQTLAGIFQDEPNDKYRLKTNGPAAKAGFNLRGVVDRDMLGQLYRPPYDMGAIRREIANLRNRWGNDTLRRPYTLLGRYSKSG
jgi:hypothetical protein